MDLFEKLGKQISEITVYDVKSAYEKAKNAVMNYTEMEAKVREATNDDPWGASSTLMQEIAESTFNYAHFNEIMPVIYKRFTEKEASEWRQIYKALQLLEYIIKHGSERVVDDARSHLSMIKMLRNFHFIDDKGKDQGINVRNRSKELAELLSDLDRVRQERRKAKANRNKYKGVGNDSMSPSFTSSSGSRYGGFGSDSMYPSHSGPPSSSFGNDSYPSSSARDTARRESFDEYDAGDDEVRSPAAASAPPARKSTATSSSSSAPRPVKKDPPPPAAPAKAVNLFDFEDDEPAAAAPAPAAAKPAHARTMSFDDDFDDFQSAAPAAAAPAPVQASIPQRAPVRAAPSSNFFDMMAPSASSAPITPVTSPPPSSNNMGYSAQPQQRTSQHMPAGPNYSGVGLFSASNNGGSARPGIMSAQSASSIPTSSSSAIAPKPAASKAGAFDFDDLFAASGAKSSASSANKSASQGGANSMANLAAQKSSSAIWGGSGATSGGNAYGGSSSNNNNDLLF